MHTNKIFQKVAVLIICGLIFTMSSQNTQAQVLINEVFPNPEFGKEWVELWLPNDHSDIISLNNWSLWDEVSAPHKIFTFPELTILPGQLISVEILNQLNNDGDSVTLKTDSGVIIDQLTYTSSQKDMSWSRSSQQDPTIYLTNPSREEPNFIPIPTATPTPQPTPTPVLSPTPASTPAPIAIPTPTSLPSQKLSLNSLDSYASQNYLPSTPVISIPPPNLITQVVSNDSAVSSQSSSPSSLVFPQPETNKYAAVSAIMGGLTLLAVASYFYSQMSDQNEKID